MPDSYVIFITENDVMGKNKAVYHIQRYVEIDEEKELFDDGSHIVYVNGKYRGNDEIGKLMHDFSCTNPNDMNYEALAKRARYFKENEKGNTGCGKVVSSGILCCAYGNAVFPYITGLTINTFWVWNLIFYMYLIFYLQ